jgi:Arc/MetJ family transcription regulator
MSHSDIYSGALKRRTTIEIDEELLGRAREVLGTKGLRDTVEAALDEVVKADLRRQLVERITSPDGLDRDALLEARRTWMD